jgi:hypothetical protein
MIKTITLKEYIDNEWINNYGKVLTDVSPWTAAHLIIEAIESLGYIITGTFDPLSRHDHCSQTFNNALVACPSLSCYKTVPHLYTQFRCAFAHSGCSALTLTGNGIETLDGDNVVISVNLLYKRFIDACHYVCITYPEQVSASCLYIA